MFADMARIQKESYNCRKKNLSHKKKSYFYFRQQEFMKAAIINRIVVACSCNNNFLTKMFFFPFAALCNFLFLDKSTKTDRRRGKNDPQAKKFLRVTTNIMTLTTIVKRLLRLKLTRMARQLYPLKSSWKIDFTQCEKRKKLLSFDKYFVKSSGRITLIDFTEFLFKHRQSKIP